MSRVRKQKAGWILGLAAAGWLACAVQMPAMAQQPGIAPRAAQAQPAPQPRKSPPSEAGEKAKFVSQCNPRNDEMIGIVCECVIESVSLVMPVAEFNRLNQLSKEGNLPPDQIKPFAQKLEQARKYLMYCVSPNGSEN